MMMFIAEFTDELGDPCTIEIEAPNLETAYEQANAQYSDMSIETIRPA